MNRRVLPLHFPEYCPWTRIGIEDRGTPPMRFGKSLDLPLSFCTFEFFRGQQRSRLILQNDAEFSLFQLLLDVFSECVQVRTLIDSKENIKIFWISCCTRIRDFDSGRSCVLIQYFYRAAPMSRNCNLTSTLHRLIVALSRKDY